MISNRYLVVAVQVITIIVMSLILAMQDDVISQVEVYQVAGVGVGAVSVYFVKLLTGHWQALLKFLTSVAGAVLAAIPPIFDEANGGKGWTSVAILIVVLAGLNAALTAWGVKVRLEDVRTQLADPAIDNRLVIAQDPHAVKALDPTAGHR